MQTLQITLLAVVFLLLLILFFKKPYFDVNELIRTSMKKAMSLAFSPIGLVAIGTLLIWYADFKGSEKTVFEIIKETGVFLFIAGIIGVALHTAEFKEKFAELLYLNSDYLKNLGKDNKKKFFINTLKKAYEFSDYGIEEDFAEITTNSYLPLFEEKHKTNHFLHRTFQPYNKTEIEDGFWISEEQGWRAHYPKNRPEQTGGHTRGTVFKNYKELFKQMTYSLELWIREVEKASTTPENAELSKEHTRCIRTEIIIRDDIKEADFDKAWGYIKNLNFDDKKAVIKACEKYFRGATPELGIEIKAYKKDKDPIAIKEAQIEITDQKSIKLRYESNGAEYANIIINLFEQRVEFEIAAPFPEVHGKHDYHFVQRSKFYNYFEEGLTLACTSPTKNIILDIVFEDLPKNMKILPEVTFLAFNGNNSMIKPVISKTHYGAKFSGWFFVKNGMVFSYRIIPCED